LGVEEMFYRLLFVLKVEQGKKRANESASKTPVSSKKSKNATPEKTGESKL
jgi:nucleophosmin 1